MQQYALSFPATDTVIPGACPRLTGMTGNLLLFRFLHCLSPLDGESPLVTFIYQKVLVIFSEKSVLNKQTRIVISGMHCHSRL